MNGAAGNVYRYVAAIGGLMFLSTVGCGGANSESGPSRNEVTHAPRAEGAAVERTTSDPRFFDPGSQPYGVSYGGWAISWCQWAQLRSPDRSPVQDLDGSLAALDQKGPVWFLAGRWGGGEVRRRCAIPAGKALFFPILNMMAHHKYEQSLSGFSENLNGVHLELDGVAVNNPLLYGLQSEEFSQTVAAGWHDETPETHTHSRMLTSGIYVMLKPLPPGEHTLQFGGRSGDFEIDVHYVLAVGDTETFTSDASVRSERSPRH